MNKFKGGPVLQNSGGSGPDDYLIKPVSGGRWTLVLFRWGRHFDTAALVEKDKVAMKKLFPLQQVCISDNARQLEKMKAHGKAPTMFAADFLEKYGAISPRAILENLISGE